MNIKKPHPESIPGYFVAGSWNVGIGPNTLMLQEVLAQPNWQGRLTETDLRALTPLIWEHVNPYGRFELDMTTRLPLK